LVKIFKVVARLIVHFSACFWRQEAVVAGNEEDDDDEDFGVEVVKNERKYGSKVLKVSFTRWSTEDRGGCHLLNVSPVQEHGEIVAMSHVPTFGLVSSRRNHVQDD
jgi:hypothetical protein